ncbi:MAG: ROK family protein [Bifidobacteriaceae bacterium]|jgi:glucokinase|nr:ROK family protein [Bifidobacteriaceae bacterium]
MDAYLAVDLGGTAVRAGWWEGGSFAESVSQPTNTRHGASGILEQITALAHGPGRPSFDRCVIATAGTLNPKTGTVLRSANLPFEDTPLRLEMANRLKVPVAVVGDAVAATLGEFCAGAGKTASDGVYMTVSTGVGCGIVTRGALISGSWQQAGELGHVPVDLSPAALPCACGQRGCLELYASGAGIAARYAAATGRTAKGGARDVIAAAERDDAAAAAVVSRATTLMAAAIGGAIRLFSPEVLVLGGGLTRSQLIVDQVRQGVDRLLNVSVPGAVNRVKLAQCQPTSALTGAALLAAGAPRAHAMVAESRFAGQLEGWL